MAYAPNLRSCTPEGKASMKTGLPPNNGLSAKLVGSELFFHDSAGPQLTDIQFEALAQGAATGKSLLVVAPTSSGKTNVGLAGLVSWIEAGQLTRRKAVYLTTHRALARQKFNDFKSLLMNVSGLESREIILTTGDGTVDAAGNSGGDPSDATVIIATYEKYLGLLSGAGIPEDLGHICFVCDELQIINDRTRGEVIEVLLTVLRRAKYGQLIGLSAVIAPNDAKALAEWLHATLVRTTHREVPISYELRTANQTLVVSTDRPDQVRPLPGARSLSTIDILDELMESPDETTPIAVFCMRRRDVFDLAKAWARRLQIPEGSPDQIPPDFVELTSAAEDLALYTPHKFAYHTADLIEPERAYVERHLDQNDLTVVFSTTTLAMGLNYSFKTVIFDRWRRYNFQRRQEEPISRSEFHNIAGRAGRLGKAEQGRVIFTAQQRIWERPGGVYLELGDFESYSARLNPEKFDHVLLQLISSGLATTRDELRAFLQGTFSAQAEIEANAHQEELWQRHIDQSLSRLREWGFIR